MLGDTQQGDAAARGRCLPRPPRGAMLALVGIALMSNPWAKRHRVSGLHILLSRQFDFIALQSTLRPDILNAILVGFLIKYDAGRDLIVAMEVKPAYLSS